MIPEEEVARLLKVRGLTLATAESCTGGLVSARMTEVPGVSAVFKGGVVSYWSEVKRDVLGVSREILDARGAVSPEVAEAMAAGARRVMGSDLAVSVTGVAGPDPDDRGNPVGLVYFGLADESGVRSFCLPGPLGGSRSEIRTRAAAFALELVRRALAGEEAPG